jgi:maleate isomerase
LVKGNPGARPTSLVGGVISALRALKAKSIAVATPYLDEINAKEAVYLERAGFEVIDIEGLNLEKDSDMVRVTPNYILEFAQAVDHPRADALFISCGALRSLDIVDELEQRIGKPVVVSNQAMIWDTWRLAGIKDQIDGYGRLLKEH